VTEKVGDKIRTENARWAFRGDVVSHFDQHVEKSVPLYKEGHELIVQLADYFLHNGAVCYELGCSTGTLTSLIAGKNQDRNINIIGVDVEEDMAAVARKRCEPFGEKVEIIVEDLNDLEFKPADIIIAYYTIQFVKPKYRQLLFDKIYESLNWGGAFILFEKTRGPDARFQDIQTSLYTEYKLQQGYSPEEIVAKSRSLKGVLEPFSTQGNMDMLKRSGFKDMITIMKYVCFEGFLAIK